MTDLLPWHWDSQYDAGLLVGIWWGWLVHGWWMRRRLRRIFDEAMIGLRQERHG